MIILVRNLIFCCHTWVAYKFFTLEQDRETLHYVREKTTVIHNFQLKKKGIVWVQYKFSPKKTTFHSTCTGWMSMGQSIPQVLNVFFLVSMYFLLKQEV